MMSNVMDEVLVSHYFTLTFRSKSRAPEKAANKLFRNLAKYTGKHLVGDYFCDIQKSRLKRTEKKVYHIHGWLADVEGTFLRDKNIIQLIEFAWLESQGSKADVQIYDYSLADGNTVYNFGHEKLTPSWFRSPRLSKCKRRTCPVCRKGGSGHRAIPKFSLHAVNVVNRTEGNKKKGKNEKNSLSSLDGRRKNLS